MKVEVQLASCVLLALIWNRQVHHSRMLALIAQQDHLHKMLVLYTVQFVMLDITQDRKLPPVSAAQQEHPPRHPARRSVSCAVQASFLIKVLRCALRVALDRFRLALAQPAQTVVLHAVMACFLGVVPYAANQSTGFALEQHQIFFQMNLLRLK
jgi:hypothetical protein